jgi:hypothetical protein
MMSATTPAPAVPFDYTGVPDVHQFAGVIGGRAFPANLERLVMKQPGHHLFKDTWRTDLPALMTVTFTGNEQMPKMCLAVAEAYPPIAVEGFEYTTMGRWATGTLLYRVPLLLAQMMNADVTGHEVSMNWQVNRPNPTTAEEMILAARLWRPTGEQDEDVSNMLSSLDTLLLEARLSGRPAQEILTTVMPLWADRDEDPDRFDEAVEVALDLLAY